MKKMAFVFLLAALLGGFGSAAPIRYWILHGPGIEAQVLATDPTGVAFLSDPSRVVIYPVVANVPPPASWHVVWWKTYASFAKFQADIAANRVPPQVKVVGYDIEAWDFTPDDEHADPLGSMIKFAKLAHAHGYKVIVTPAINLMRRLHPGVNKYTAFTASGIAKAVAPYVDFYHIQSQGLQHNVDGPAPSFKSFVLDMVEQVHSANPSVIVTAGLTTITPGRRIPSDPDEIVEAVRAVDPYVSGYWLNIVGGHNSTALDALSKLATPTR